MTVLADARAALDTGPLCDPCLGRLFAARSHGLANAERGRALRVTLALAADDPVDPDERDTCWVCEGETDRYEELAERAATAARGYEFDTYQVGTRVPPLLEENDALLREEAGVEDGAEALNTECNREVGKRVGRRTEAEVEFGRPDVQFTLDLATDEVEVDVNSTFVYGRYRKHERGIPQTEWPCRDCNETGIKRGEECPGCDGTGYRYDRSVEELTAPHAVDAFEGTDATFHGAGREDVDAKMLGTGRPFVIEVDEPRRRRIDLDALEGTINDAAAGAVAVQDLAHATHEMVERVKELDAGKTYRMAVDLAEPVEAGELAAAVNTLEGTTVEQRTPDRVDHRRADKVRTRDVYAAEAALTDGGATQGVEPGGQPGTASEATLRVEGEGGLYVKELVSGDDGRTTPSLAGELGVPAEVTALDVLAVEGEDEPFADPKFLRE